MANLLRAFREQFGVPAPVTAAATVPHLMFNRTNVSIEVRVENPVSHNETNASATFKLQDCEDDSTWADVSGSSGTVVPGGYLAFSVRVRKYVRAFAGGGADLIVLVSADEGASQLSRI